MLCFSRSVRPSKSVWSLRTLLSIFATHRRPFWRASAVPACMDDEEVAETTKLERISIRNEVANMVTICSSFSCYSCCNCCFWRCCCCCCSRVFQCRHPQHPKDLEKQKISWLLQPTIRIVSKFAHEQTCPRQRISHDSIHCTCTCTRSSMCTHILNNAFKLCCTVHCHEMRLDSYRKSPMNKIHAKELATIAYMHMCTLSNMHTHIAQCFQTVLYIAVQCNTQTSQCIITQWHKSTRSNTTHSLIHSFRLFS